MAEKMPFQVNVSTTFDTYCLSQACINQNTLLADR